MAATFAFANLILCLLVTTVWPVCLASTVVNIIFVLASTTMPVIEIRFEKLP